MHVPLSSFLFFSIILITACQEKEVTGTPLQPQFDSVPTAHIVKPLIQEASGIADSKMVPHTLWVQEDSGNPPQLYSLNYNGTVRKTVFIKGATNRDWEDLARAGDTLYVADIGDNNQVFSEYTIYKFAEPQTNVDTVRQFKTIRFRYADKAHDAEALLVDTVTNAIYIITKRDKVSLVFKIENPSTGLNTAIQVGQLTYNNVVSATLSPDGSEVLVKTYTTIFRYIRGKLSIEAALQGTPMSLSYVLEPQGEAITFATDNSGFFTLSEKGMSKVVNLYFYKRN
jgi:hypothetical protein